MNMKIEKDYEKEMKKAAARAMRYRRAYHRLMKRRILRWIARLFHLIAFPANILPRRVAHGIE